MSSTEFQQLLAIVPALSPEQRRLLQERVDATESERARSAADVDQALQSRLFEMGAITEIRPAQAFIGQDFAPIEVVGESISTTIIRERR